uniref:Exostosin GT47 domain-containing protein n=1 Tax=Setaria viridis TaxID=4556 RepID=A0A4U6SZF0_SETVI|nr:hypothetical protein SEVIR_9G231500v2 [Setaria viridis]
MDKSSSTVTPRLRFLMVVSAVFWVLELCLRLTVLTSVRIVGAGYVYIHDLPSRFNEDILRGCGAAGRRWPDMCNDVSNGGLGRPLDGVAGDGAALTGANGWYATHQFALDAIFHARMRRYECLTNDSSAAAAVFVPFYAGFDYALHCGGGDGDDDNAARDAASLDLARWLVRRPEWRRSGGRDHFLVAGRTTWDFRRRGTNLLLLLPAIRNMTVLVVESSNPGGAAGNDVAVPYPTSFHPRTDAEVLRWQRRIRRSRRRWLMSFAGSPRADDQLSVRSQVIVQCAASPACRQLRFAAGSSQSQC